MQAQPHTILSELNQSSFGERLSVWVDTHLGDAVDRKVHSIIKEFVPSRLKHVEGQVGPPYVVNEATPERKTVATLRGFLVSCSGLYAIGIAAGCELRTR